MADDGSRRDRTRLSATEFQMMALLVIIGLTVGVLGGALTYPYNHEIAKLFWGAAISLMFGALLGGVVKLLFEDFDLRRAQRAAQMDFISRVLGDLKGVYDAVDRAKTLITARRSAKTYGEEMLNLIEARVALKNVKRALETDERKEPIASVLAHVEGMENYLSQLLREYEEQYKDVSLMQSIFEAQMKKALDPPPASDAIGGLPQNVPWQRISSLPQLKDFLAVVDRAGTPASRYRKEFLDSLDRASEILRAALASQLRQSR